MTFTVEFSDGVTTDYTGNAKFTIKENAVLVINLDGERNHYAPHAWRHVQQTVREGRGRVVVSG